MLYLAFGEPWVGIRFYRRLAADPTSESRLRFYRATVGLEWSLAVATLAVAAAGGLTLRDFGVTWPRAIGSPVVLGLAAGVLVGGAMGVAFSWARGVQGAPRRRGAQGPFAESLRPLLPTTPRERTWMAAVALTAGTCEEFLFRGLVHEWLGATFPGLPAAAVVAVAAIVFGVAHAYQGPRGVFGTALVGALFSAILVATGSLLVPVLAHVLIDLRPVFVREHGLADDRPAAID